MFLLCREGGGFILDIYTLLSGIIEPICPCFVSEYPTDTEKTYPYVVINFPNSLPNNSFSDNNLLEVDVWDDKGTDIREIETMTDNIHFVLNNLHYIDAKMQLTIARNTPYRLKLPDEMIGIQRRQLRYIVKVYKIEGVI